MDLQYSQRVSESLVQCSDGHRTDSDLPPLIFQQNLTEFYREKIDSLPPRLRNSIVFLYRFRIRSFELCCRDTSLHGLGAFSRSQWPGCPTGMQRSDPVDTIASSTHRIAWHRKWIAGYVPRKSISLVCRSKRRDQKRDRNRPCQEPDRVDQELSIHHVLVAQV